MMNVKGISHPGQKARQGQQPGNAVSGAPTQLTTVNSALGNTPPQFGNAGVKAGLSKYQKLLNHFDFPEVGRSHVKQIQLIYGVCIGWRLIAANQRRKASPSKSFNEIREGLIRDTLGYLFWFYAVPTLQRGYLKTCTPQNIRNSLVETAKTGKSKETQGIKGFFNNLNPLAKYNIPSSEQVKDQMEQALRALEKAGFEKPGAEALKKNPALLKSNVFAKTEAYYNNLIKHRNLATGLGLGTTILLLGVLINLLNIAITKRNVARQKEAMVQKTPQTPAPPPTLPLPNAPFANARLPYPQPPVR